MKQRVLAQRNILSKQRQIIRECSFPKRIQTHTQAQNTTTKRGMQKSNGMERESGSGRERE